MAQGRLLNSQESSITLMTFQDEWGLDYDETQPQLLAAAHILFWSYRVWNSILSEHPA